MEPLPRGANFIRAKMLWEMGLHIAGDPTIPYGGDRDVVITIGSGSGTQFRPALRMATGSAILAEAVAKGSLEMAIVNPSALLTQAVRGVGLFKAPLPLRVIAVYPSWDRFVIAIHPRTGLRSLGELVAKRYPLRVSVREDTTHSTRVLIDQILSLYGATLADIEAWGGRLMLAGPPNDARRMAAIKNGELDAIFDEGITTWLDAALQGGLVPIELEPATLAQITALGWRAVVLPAARYPRLARDYAAIDFSGWPLYASAALPDRLAYAACRALAARADEIPWDAKSYDGIAQLGRDTEATPIDVPLHPGAARWYREHAGAA
jgi:TRAP-type uncharacterized transport system substrate-binding protein